MPKLNPLFRAAIEEMEGYAPGEWPALDSGVLKLNSNENPYPPSPKVLDALTEINGELLRRYPNPRGQTFCEIAGEMFGVPTDWIMVGNGSDDLLTLLIRACAEPGVRSLAYPMPTYVLYRTLAAMQPAQTQEIVYQQSGTDWILPIDELIAAKAAITLIATPNSPTGHVVPVSDLRRLAQGVSGVLVIDEAYVDFVGEGADKTSLALVHEFENVIVLRTLSKGYGLAGLRLGFALAQPSLLKGLLKVKDSYNVDAIALKLGAAALKDQSYKNSCVQKIITARNQLSEDLRALSFKVWPSQTNFLLVQPPANTAENEATANNTAEKIYLDLKENGIMIRYFAQPGLDDKLRITVGTSAQNKRVVSAIASLLKHS
ncbi:MAG: histidinol-phosphate transaminase [Cyanobacteria bacterium J06621_11]